MIPRPLSRALTLLRVVLGLSIAWLSAATAFAPHAEMALHHPGLGGFVRVLAAVEFVAALLLLIPGAVALAARTLLAVFAVAIGVHLLHGEWQVAPLLIYAAATAVVLAGHRIDRVTSPARGVEP